MYIAQGRGWQGNRAAAAAAAAAAGGGGGGATSGTMAHQTNNPHSRSIFASRRGGAGNRYNDGTCQGSGGDGGGQVQLMVQRQQVQPTTLEQKQNGGITMEEVMNDLRILEEQQKESEQKLLQAQRAKEQRLADLQIYEDKLQKVKYKNGQDRAYIQRIRESLASGQRTLQACKDDETWFRKDLECVGQTLSTGLRVVRNLQVTKRRQECALSQSLHVHASVQSLLRRAYDRRSVTMAKRQALLLQQQALHLEIQGALSTYQTTQQEMAHEREQCNQLERWLDGIQTKITQVKKNGENLALGMDHEVKRFQDRVVASEDSLELRRSDSTPMKNKIKSLLEEIKESKEVAHKAWSQVHLHRVAEGKDDGSAPSTSDAATRQSIPFDFEQLRASVVVEAQAVQDEAAALNALREEFNSLCREKETSIMECKAKRDNVLSMSNSYLKAKTMQTKRMDVAGKLVGDHEAAKERRNKRNKEVKHLQEHLNNEFAQALKRLKGANEVFQQVETSLVEAKSHASSVTLQIQKNESDFKDANERGKSQLSVNEHLAACKETYDKLGREIEVASGNLLETDGEFALEGFVQSIDHINSEIHELVAEFPQIESVPFKFDPDLDLASQVERALGKLRKACENRVNSAIKMALALREAKEQEAQERALVEREAAAEEQRGEEARRQRKKRLQEDETEEERLRREDRKRRRERKREQLLLAGITAIQKVKKDSGLSAAKPRVLLKSFSQASDESLLGLDNAPTIFERNVESVPASTQEKKVHWVDERNLQLNTQSLERNDVLTSRRQESKSKEGTVLHLPKITKQGNGTSLMKSRDKKSQIPMPSNHYDKRSDWLASEKVPCERDASGPEGAKLKSVRKASRTSRHEDCNLKEVINTATSANNRHSKDSTSTRKTSTATDTLRHGNDIATLEHRQDAGGLFQRRESTTFAKCKEKKPVKDTGTSRKHIVASRPTPNDPKRAAGTKAMPKVTCDTTGALAPCNDDGGETKKMRSDFSKSSRALTQPREPLPGFPTKQIALEKHKHSSTALASSGSSGALQESKILHRSKHGCHETSRIQGSDGMVKADRSKKDSSVQSTKERSKLRTATGPSREQNPDNGRKAGKSEHRSVDHNKMGRTKYQLPADVQESRPNKEESRHNSLKHSKLSNNSTVKAKRRRSGDQSTLKSIEVASSKSAPHPPQRRKTGSSDGRKKLEWYADDSHCRFL